MSYLEKVMEARDDEHRIAVDTWNSDDTGPAVRFRCYTDHQKEGDPLVEVVLGYDDAMEFSDWIKKTAKLAMDEK